MPAKRSCAAEVSLGGNDGHRDFLLNYPPNKTIGGDTPYKMVYGKYADLPFLRTIGARGFMYNERHLRKLDFRALEGVLIGYDDDKPTYRIYFRDMDQVISTRNIAFIEVPLAVISTAIGAGGQHDDGELVY